MFKWNNLFRSAPVAEPVSGPTRITIPIFSEDVALGHIANRQIENLSDEELKTLWFVIDKYLDTQTLGEVYCEMKKRNLHVLLPSELLGKQDEMLAAVIKASGITADHKPKVTVKWSPDNHNYVEKLS